MANANRSNQQSQHVYLVYDHQCPFCREYSKLIQIRQAVGHLILIDARQDSQIMQRITNAGLDIDQGMVLILNDKLHYGSDAAHMLGLLSSRVGWFNRLNYLIFSRKHAAYVFYPLFKTIRNVTLKLLNIPLIHNLQRKS